MTLRSRDKAALGAIAGVLLIVAFYLLVLAPVRHSASHLNTQIAAEQQTLSAAENTVEAGRSARVSLRRDAQQWRALGVAVPRSSNIPALLEVIAAAARKAQVKVKSIDLAGGSSAATPTSPITPTASGTPGSSTEAAVPVPVSLSLSGDYQALNRLLRRLDSLVVITGNHVRASGPLMSISSVSLTGSGSDITAQVSASIYQLSTPAQTASTPTGAA